MGCCIYTWLSRTNVSHTQLSSELVLGAAHIQLHKLPSETQSWVWKYGRQMTQLEQVLMPSNHRHKCSISCPSRAKPGLVEMAPISNGQVTCWYRGWFGNWCMWVQDMFLLICPFFFFFVWVKNKLGVATMFKSCECFHDSRINKHIFNSCLVWWPKGDQKENNARMKSSCWHLTTTGTLHSIFKSTHHHPLPWTKHMYHLQHAAPNLSERKRFLQMQVPSAAFEVAVIGTRVKADPSIHEIHTSKMVNQECLAFD